MRSIEAELQRLRRLHRLAGGGEVDGGLGRDEAGQADGAACAGDDAEGDLGEADGGGGEGDAEAAAERDLEAAAEGGAVDGGGPGFFRRLDAGDEVGEVRRLRRLAELGDVGAGDEGAAGADQDDGVDRRVGVEGLRGVPEGLAEGLRRGRSPAGCRR